MISSSDTQARTPWSGLLLDAAQASHGDPTPTVRILRGLGHPPLPGRGGTVALWSVLSEVASIDLAAARTLEPHLDAAAIMDQAGVDFPGGAWGVFAAEGPGTGLHAETDTNGSLTLSGTKPWCSLATLLDHAVITAQVPAGRQAFVVDLHSPGIHAEPGAWAGHGLAQVHSGPVHFDQVPVQPLGGPGWYLHRPGFAWGAMGVAACWYGGTVGLYRTLYAAAHRREPDQLALAWLGEADRLLAGARHCLDAAAATVDAGQGDWIDAHRLRGQVARMGSRLLEICQVALGPGPLAFDEDHSRRVADLTLYLRQHHDSRDDAALGRMLVDEGRSRW